ncbi:MAG: hypothetical protein MJ198_10320 [Bacteroidales bacterium]|nr:hypothetical protein [Bacteroidales bacterium]
MNTTYILGLFLLAITIIPILLLNLNTYKKNKIIKKELEKLGCSAKITKQDYWNGYLIAIDEIAKRCFYIHKKDDCCTTELDLNQYKDCHIVTSRTLDKSDSCIELIELVFTPKNKQMENKALVFYDADSDGFTLNGELQTAGRWNKICNACLHM